MKDDLLRRLRQKVVRTDNNGQSYFVSRNIDGDEAAGEIERLIAELAALRENSLAVLTRVRGYRDKVITERDALRGLLREARDTLQPISALVDITPGGFPDHDICPIRLGAARELRELHARIDAAIGVEDE